MPSRWPPLTGLPDDRVRRERAGPVPGPREPMSRLSRSALIVSDSAPLRRYIAASLAGARIICSEAASGLQAMDLISDRVFALYIVDLDMAANDGLAIFAIALAGRDQQASQAVIGCSEAPDEAMRREPWAGTKLFARLTKPFQPADIIAAAESALAERPQA